MMKFSKIIILLFLTGLVKAQISVIAEIDHVKPDGVDTRGNIFLTVSGGTPAYSYTWTPGPVTVRDYTNAAMNLYTLQTVDAGTNTVTYFYNLGYKTRWTDFVSCIARNDSIIQISPTTSSGFATAVSKNTLKGSTNGWVEWVVGNASNYYLVGFIEALTDQSYSLNDVQHGLYLAGGNLYYISNGSTSFLASCNNGDVLTIQRTGNLVDFLQNQVSLGSYTLAAPVIAKDWKIKTQNYYGDLANIGASFYDSTNTTFTNYVQDIPVIKHATPGYTNGNISLTPAYGGTHSYTWSPGSYTTSSITNKAFGTYSVNIKDANGNASTYTYNIGYKTKWKNFYGSSFLNDSIFLTGSVSGAWHSASSINTLKGADDGWMEYVVNTLSDNSLIGFLDTLSPLCSQYADIDYGYYMTNNLLYYINMGAVYPASVSYKLGDVLRIEKVGTSVNFKLNSVALSTVAIPMAAQNLDWKLKGILTNEALINIGVSFYDSTNVHFQNYVKEYPSIEPTSGAGGNNGSIELSPIENLGPHSYTWSPGSYTTALLAGLDAISYSVTAKDEFQNTSDIIYNPEYKLYWNSGYGISLHYDSLFTSVSPYGTTISKDSIDTGDDGNVQFVVDTVATSRIIGLLDSVYSPTDFDDLDYGIYQYYDIIYYAYNNSVSLLSYCSKGDIIKIEKIDTVVNVKLNETIIGSYTIPPNRRWKHLYAKTAISPGYYYARLSTTIVPIITISKNYAVPKKKLDGDYYTTANNKLYFALDGDYALDNLDYTVYNYSRAVQSSVSLNVSTTAKGDNRYEMNISSLGSGYYVLELRNQKKEKLMLRFKK